MTFRDRLRDEIEYQGMMVKEVAEKAQLNQSTFLSYVDARQVTPSAEAAVKIAKVLGVTVEYLVTGTQDESPPEKHVPKKYREIILECEKLSPESFMILKPMLVNMIQAIQKVSLQQFQSKKTIVS